MHIDFLKNFLYYEAVLQNSLLVIIVIKLILVEFFAINLRIKNSKRSHSDSKVKWNVNTSIIIGQKNTKDE